MMLHNGRLISSRFGEILKRGATTDSTRLVIDIMGYNGTTGAPITCNSIGQRK